MKIKEIVSQNRRDFQAIYACEGCGHEIKESGYDDRNFHDNVVPAMKCEKCGKSRKDLGIVGKKVETKYPSWMDI
jgi:ribosomal protein L37AE/L43A